LIVLTNNFVIAYGNINDFIYLFHPYSYTIWF
jgi:hypothetical protein